MFSNIFKTKISSKRLARAIEHEDMQRQQDEIKQRSKLLLERLERRKSALKADK